MAPDYSLESHSEDLVNFMSNSQVSYRRARAIIDFERKEEDELGFRRNDLIVVLNQRDEHCWVGELRGLVGWFPAKFVELLDERSKQYSEAGDDQVSETVTDLVRGGLCPALVRILQQGLVRGRLPGRSHTWHMVMEAAMEAVQGDLGSVVSRLVLCKTFKLDEDGKILSPEELLYRCVHLINHTHDKAGVSMDVKLRSLICLGLNEQVLHLWLECLASAEKTLNKWYRSNSLLASPAWVLIKCELRILAQFSFQLSADWELPSRKQEGGDSMKEGVCDMLVKHHLFSWEL